MNEKQVSFAATKSKIKSKIDLYRVVWSIVSQLGHDFEKALL